MLASPSAKALKQKSQDNDVDNPDNIINSQLLLFISFMYLYFFLNNVIVVNIIRTTIVLKNVISVVLVFSIPILLNTVVVLVKTAVRIAQSIHLLSFESFDSFFIVKNVPNNINTIDIIFIVVIFSFKNRDDNINVNTILVLSTGVTLLTVPRSKALK